MMTSDRLMLVSVPKSVLMLLGDVSGYEKCGPLIHTEFLKGITENLPEGFQVQRCQFNMMRASLDFVVSHDSFKPVPDGNLLMDFPVKFKENPHWGSRWR